MRYFKLSLTICVFVDLSSTTFIATSPGADLAKISPFVLQPETFALHVGGFLLARYAHLSKAFVDVEVLRWQRIKLPVEGQDGKRTGMRSGGTGRRSGW